MKTIIGHFITKMGVEARVAAPGPGYVWVGGFHRWESARSVWTPGRWTAPPRPTRAMGRGSLVARSARLLLA